MPHIVHDNMSCEGRKICGRIRRSACHGEDTVNITGKNETKKTRTTTEIYMSIVASSSIPRSQFLNWSHFSWPQARRGERESEERRSLIELSQISHRIPIPYIFELYLLYLFCGQEFRLLWRINLTRWKHAFPCRSQRHIYRKWNEIVPCVSLPMFSVYINGRRFRRTLRCHNVRTSFKIRSNISSPGTHSSHPFYVVCFGSIKTPCI